MKFFKWIFTIVALLLVSYIVYAWWSNRNYFESGETGNFTIKVGETIQFQLFENSSTGYQNCWINASHCTSIALVDKTYAGNPQSKLGYIGAGERVTLRFKGIKKGFDTVAIAHCPTGVEGKDCSRFSIDSIKPDNVFIINVE